LAKTFPDEEEVSLFCTKVLERIVVVDCLGGRDAEEVDLDADEMGVVGLD